MTRFRGPGRRGLRDELQSTWNVYDAVRPIRKEDLELAGECTAPAQAEPPQPSASPPHDAEAATHGGATSNTITLTNAEDVARFTKATDAELAAMFGLTEMDVRESRRWARENADRLGAVTVTGVDATTGKVTIQ